MSFDQSLQRLNAAMRRVANAQATLGGAPDPVQVVYDNGHGVSLDTMAVLRPRIALAQADAAGVDVDSDVQIVGGPAYTVQTVEPDGAGWVELSLGLAA